MNFLLKIRPFSREKAALFSHFLKKHFTKYEFNGIMLVCAVRIIFEHAHEYERFKESFMEQQNVQVEEGIRLSDIFKLLLSKIKFLILAVLIGGILGGSFAIWKTIDVNYYGTTVEFYVNPKNPSTGNTTGDSQYGVYGAYGQHVMDNMVRLLSSESFSEKMILNGKTLPDLEKESWVNPENPDEVALDLAGKVALASVEVKNVETIQAALNALVVDKNAKELVLSERTQALSDEWTKLAKAGSVNTTTFNELDYIKAKNEGQYTDAIFNDLHDAYDARENARTDVKNKEAEITAKQNEKADAEDIANPLVNAALEAWRATAKYKAQLRVYNAAVSFSYQKGNVDSSTANNLARSFIYVTISILNEQDFAIDLLEKVKTVVPAYVEANMTVPSGYTGTNCQRITRSDDIHLTNPNYTLKQTILYGLLGGIAALAIVSIVFIALDRSDKRLRDPDLLARELNVPLLGLIPIIEELNKESTGKKSDKSATEVK